MKFSGLIDRRHRFPGTGALAIAFQCPASQNGGAGEPCARVAELVDALDLGSSGQPWGFESPLSHQHVGRIRGQIRDEV